MNTTKGKVTLGLALAAGLVGFSLGLGVRSDALAGSKPYALHVVRPSSWRSTRQ